MKTILKIISYLGLGIIALIFLLLIFTQTGWFRNILKDQIENIANAQLNGVLSIDEIKGNFYSDLEISKIRIEKDKETLIYIDEISLEYNLTEILFKKIDIDVIKIDSLFLFLKQENDSTWNLANLMKASPEEEEPDTSQSEFDWNIGLGLFELVSSEAQIATLDTPSSVPQKIDNFNISASGELTAEFKKFILYTFSLQTYSPAFQIKDLDILAEMSKEIIEIKKFDLKTGLNRYVISAKYDANNVEGSTLTLRSDPVDFNEFKPFLPALSIKAKPLIKIDAAYHKSITDVNLSIEDENQSVELNARVRELDADPAYDLAVVIDSIQLDQWADFPQMDSEINGAININGSGSSMETFNIESEIIILESRIKGLHLDTLRVISNVRRDDLNSIISLSSGFGNLSGDIKLTGIENEKQYNINLDVGSLNIAPILNDMELESDINFSLKVNGEGFEPESMNADLSFIMNESKVMDYEINSIRTSLNADRGSFYVDTMNFISDYAELNLNGIMSMTGRNDFSFSLIPKDISSIPQISDVGVLSLAGQVTGSLDGYIDSLASHIDISFSDMVYENYSVENLSGKIELSKINDSLNSTLKSEISDIDLDGVPISKINVDALYAGNKLQSGLIVDINDTSSAEIISEVISDSILTVLLKDFSFKISDYRWTNLNDSMKVTISDDKYSITDFKISNGEQLIDIEGYFDPSGNNDLRLKIHQLQIGDLLNTVKKDLSINALLNTDIGIKGNLENPELKGSFGIADLNYNNEFLGDLKADFGLIDKKFEYDLSADVNNNKLSSNGFLELEINADDSSSIIPFDKPLDINLKMEIPTLAPFAKYIEPVEKLDGKISTEMRFSNSLDDLDLNGFFRIDNTSVESGLYGINFSNIDLNFEAENKSYYLREFLIENDEGKLSIEGFTEFKNGLLSGNPSNINININADEFEIVRSRNLEAKVDGSINFINDAGDAKFDGNVKVLRSRVYIPYFTESSSKEVSEESKPLLVRELEEKRIVSDTISIKPLAVVNDSAAQNSFIKNIQGRFRLEIPKNTWLVSPDMNIELKGELDVVKESEIVELYGTVETVRGKLAVYGKEFSILTGQIIFEGGSEVNPQLNIKLEYMFRGADKSKRYLGLSVQGNAKQPELHFKLDEAEIDEGNAISYILFGKSLDELSQGQKSNVKSSNEDLAKTLAGNLVAAQLQNSIGNALGMDVIEIKGENSWKQASLTAGKYLTDDLYVSYEKGFGSSEMGEVNPSIVTLEYGILEFLFFQLVEGNDKTAGFDFIFKFHF